MLRHGPLGQSRSENPGSNGVNPDKMALNCNGPNAGLTHTPDVANPPDNTKRHSYSVQPIPPPTDVPYSPVSTNVSTSSAPNVSENASEEDSSLRQDSSILDDEETFVYESHDSQELPASILKQILGHESLKKLSLKENMLQSLPRSLNMLSSSLYYLNLSRNQFESVPEVVSELHSLEILDLSHNSLSTLPSQLSKLPQLMGLSLVSNDFEVLPPVIADLPKLEILELENNPLKLPVNIPDSESSGDSESWVLQIKELIMKNRASLVHALAEIGRAHV